MSGVLWAAWLACARPEISAPPPLLVQVSGLVPRYEAALTEPGRLAELSQALQGCVQEPSLQVVYADGQGRMTLSGHFVGCRPRADGERVDLSALLPASRALARYRDAVAVQIERRLATFTLELALGACRLQLAGQLPPDGTSFSACIGAEGQPPCPRGLDGVVSVSSPVLADCVRALP